MRKTMRRRRHEPCILHIHKLKGREKSRPRMPRMVSAYNSICGTLGRSK